MIKAEIFEAIMLICFGLAWPVSIYKTWIARRNDGKSVYFLYVILIGYISGIIFQHLSNPKASLVMGLFILNTCMVTIDIILYYRNERLAKNQD